MKNIALLFIPRTNFNLTLSLHSRPSSKHILTGMLPKNFSTNPVMLKKLTAKFPSTSERLSGGGIQSIIHKPARDLSYWTKKNIRLTFDLDSVEMLRRFLYGIESSVQSVFLFYKSFHKDHFHVIAWTEDPLDCPHITDQNRYRLDAILEKRINSVLFTKKYLNKPAILQMEQEIIHSS